MTSYIFFFLRILLSLQKKLWFFYCILKFDNLSWADKKIGCSIGEKLDECSFEKHFKLFSKNFTFLPMQHCKTFAVTLVSLPGSICSLPLESVVLVAGIWNFTIFFLTLGKLTAAFFLKIFHFLTFTSTTRIWISTINYHQPWLTTGKFTDNYIICMITEF